MKSKQLKTEPAARATAPDRAPVSGELPLSLIFFLSGAAGLIFEVVWFHRCGLAFGNSLWSTSIVLSSFMGGLALGSALVAWLGRRIDRLVRTYAALEIIVAVTGIGLTYGLSELPGLLAPITRAAVGAPWIINLVRLVVAFSILLVPATAMGATLPVLVGALCRWRHDFGQVLGRLYGWNTLGAVTGVVSAEVILIARLGVTRSAWIAAGLNLAAAAAALWISYRQRSSAGAEDWRLCDVSAGAPAAVGSRRSMPLGDASRMLASIFLAGGALMALEVVWVRFLSMFVSNSTLAMSLTLAVVLASIAMGGFAASSWLRRRSDAVIWIPALALTAGLASALSYVLFQSVTEGSLVAEWYRIIYFASALTFLTCLLSGVLFTLLGEALKRHIVVEAEAAGWLTLANTFGAMCGSLVAAFVMLPVFGMERSFFTLAAVYVVIALLVVRDTLPKRAGAANWTFGVMALVAVVVLGAFPFGLMTTAYFPRVLQTYAAQGESVVTAREGSAQTLFLMQNSWRGEPMYHRLVTNGFSMTASVLPAKRYMRYFAYWPALLHEAPLRRALVICYGIGVTAGAVTDLESLASIDVVELSPDVIRMSDVMYRPEAHPLHDPRVRLHLEDGRFFLQTTGERFDLITGEPPPPRTPGTVNLYTREYFQLVHDRLAEGGITTYWLPVARPEPEEVNVTAIIRAFCDVFEDCSLWNATPFDWMLVGTRHARGPVSEAQFSDLWNHPIVGARLREVGFELPQQIGATFLGDAGYLKQLTSDTTPLTDDYPRQVDSAYAKVSPSDPHVRSRVNFYQGVIDPDRARSAFESSEFIRRLWPAALIRETKPFFEYQRTINRVLFEGPNALRQIENLHAVLTETTLHALPLWILGLGNHPIQQHVVRMRNDESGEGEYLRGLQALVARDYPEATDYLARSLQHGYAASRPLLAYAYCLAGRMEAAGRLVPDVKPPDTDEADFWVWLDATSRSGHFALDTTLQKP